MMVKARNVQCLVRSAAPAGAVTIFTAGAVALLAVAPLVGCTVYQTSPGVYSSTPPPAQPSAFDRSWNAALSAMEEQGVTISSADRPTGIIKGHRGGIDMTANVRPQPDGTVQVKFNTGGNTAQDPQLISRVSRAFDARMGY
jgi:hypothetical protein